MRSSPGPTSAERFDAAYPIGGLIVAQAREWIGTPFQWEASLRGEACDCRGLIAGVARELGRPEAAAIEATLIGYSRRVDPVALRAGLDRLFDPVPLARPAAGLLPGEGQAGDILLLAVGALLEPIHLALYAGDGHMIHTYARGPGQVLEVPMGSIWRRGVRGAWRWKTVPGGSNG